MPDKDQEVLNSFCKKRNKGIYNTATRLRLRLHAVKLPFTFSSSRSVHRSGRCMQRDGDIRKCFVWGPLESACIVDNGPCLKVYEQHRMNFSSSNQESYARTKVNRRIAESNDDLPANRKRRNVSKGKSQKKIHGKAAIKAKAGNYSLGNGYGTKLGNAGFWTLMGFLGTCDRETWGLCDTEGQLSVGIWQTVLGACLTPYMRGQDQGST